MHGLEDDFAREKLVAEYSCRELHEADETNLLQEEGDGKTQQLGPKLWEIVGEQQGILKIPEIGGDERKMNEYGESQSLSSRGGWTH
ncbi:hypothetical protein JHK82_039816 [Glycine max]|nr:hypothetical protein JHK82_039816 [Glycine max]